jgi:hypothetical protein
MLGAVAARATPPDVDAARRHYTSALRLAQERGLRPLTAHCHSDLAALYEAAGQPDLADRHRAMSLDISREIGMAAPVSPVAPA